MLQLMKKEEEKIKNYFIISEYKQGLVIFSDGFNLNKKKIKEIKKFLEYYGNSLDTFICFKKKLSNDLVKNYIELDCNEKEMHIGKNTTNISKILIDNYLPTVIIDCHDIGCLEDITKKILEINEQTQIIILGNKDNVYDYDNIYRKNCASLNSYFCSENITDELVKSMVVWKNDFHPLKKRGKPTVKVFKYE